VFTAKVLQLLQFSVLNFELDWKADEIQNMFQYKNVVGKKAAGNRFC
jgi:hypothetical protein